MSPASRWAPTPQQTLKAFREAEAYDGPSLILAYSHCIAHGINMQKGLDQQNRAVHSGYWPLVRYNPTARQSGENPFVLELTPADDEAARLRRQRACVIGCSGTPIRRRRTG